MKTFKVTQKLKQATYCYIVTHLLTKSEQKPLAKLFLELNTKNDGELDRDQIQQAFQENFGNQIEAEEMDRMLQIIDTTGRNKIEFSQFLMACIPEKVLLTNENMAVVFKIFDEDGSGQISMEEVQRVFEVFTRKSMSDEVSTGILQQIDINRDGNLNFDEFIYLMKNVA